MSAHRITYTPPPLVTSTRIGRRILIGAAVIGALWLTAILLPAGNHPRAPVTACATQASR